MTYADAVRHFDAQPTGTGKSMASCPAHPDPDPSLSIAEGRDGRVLIHCFAGCTVEAVLKAAGLRMSDLFPGPPPTAEQARQLAADRLQRERTVRALRLQCRHRADRYRKLGAVVESLGEKLARLPDDAPAAVILASLFHHALARQRATLAELEEEATR